jgi:AcrR family transcriptional regulator
LVLQGDAGVDDDDLAGVRLRRTPVQARSRDKVSRAIAAAERLLDRDGPEGLTITAVAAEAGISVGALHQYLPDREAIVAALADRYHRRLEAAMERVVAAAGRPDDDPVGTAVRALAGVFAATSGVRSMRSGHPHDDESRAHRDRMVDGVRRGLVAQGLLDDDERAAVRAHVLFVAIDAGLREAFAADPGGDPSLVAATADLARAYLRSVAPR